MLEVRTGREGLKAARDVWAQVEAGLDEVRFYHCPEWYEAYLDELEPRSDLVSFVVVRRGGDPVAIVPVRRRWAFMHCPGIRVLELPWHAHMPIGEGVVLPGAEDALVPALLRAHAEGVLPWDVLRAHNAPRDGGFLRAIREGAARAKLDAVVRPTPGANELVLGDHPDHASYLHSLTRTMRSNLRNAENRLKRRSGPPGYVVARTPTDLEAGFENFLRLEASGWKGSRGTGSAVVLHPHLVRFYRALLRHFGERGGARVQTLVDGSTAIAAWISLQPRNVLSSLKIAYDDDYARCSPGMLLMERVLADAAGDPGIGVVDLVSAMSWHEVWAPRRREMAQLHLLNDTTAGRMAGGLLRGRSRMAPLYHGLRRRLPHGGFLLAGGFKAEPIG